jgi:hypothetical protein
MQGQRLRSTKPRRCSAYSCDERRFPGRLRGFPFDFGPADSFMSTITELIG